MTSVLRRTLIASAVCLSFAVLPTQGVAENVPIVDGKLWAASSNAERKAYLIGASNFIVLEDAVQSEAKKPPTPYQSSVPDFYRYTSDVTLDGAIQVIDGWYTNNPGKTDTPVLTVLWKALVEPKL